MKPVGRIAGITPHKLITPGQASRFFSFFVFIFAISALALDPQKRITQFAHQSWGAADGLDQVLSVAQTADGYIWAGTANGLFRIDGFHVKQWEPRPGEPKLTGPASLLHGAKDGSLWIASVGHMLRLENGRLTDFPLPGAPPGTVMYRLQEGRDGIIWIATNFGLFRFVKARWEKVELPSHIANPPVPTLLIDQGGTVWVSAFDWERPSDGRLLFLRPGETHFRTVFEPVGSLLDMVESPDRRIWMSLPLTRRIPVLEDNARPPYLTAREVSVEADELLFDRDGNLWTTSRDFGVTKVDRKTVEATNDLISTESNGDHINHFTHQGGLSSAIPNCIFEDREGNIWVGTTAGLVRFAETKITVLSHRDGVPYDSNLSIQATPDGNIWAFSTVDGLEKIDPEGHYTAIGWKGLTGPGPHPCYCLYADKRGGIIAGTAKGLALVRQGNLSDFPLPEGLELHAVFAVTRDAAGGLWLCDHDKGVFRVLDDKLERFPELKRPRTEYAITAHTDSSGRVWFGYANGGIVCYDKGKILHLTSQDGLFPGQVRTIFSDDKGRIWAAGDGGISLFENGLFHTLARGNGLRDDDIYAVLEDDEQCFWIAGVHGLFRVARAKLEQALSGRIQSVDGQLFEVNDGIGGIVRHTPTVAAFRTKDLTYTVAAKGPDGKLWFSTSEGLAIVDPRHIPINQIPPAVHIEQVIAAGKTNYAFVHLNLPKGTRDCEIDFVGLSFANPSRVRYQYKLEGYDIDWKSDTRRQAVYSYLRPKAYRFQVRACNSDGVWNETGDSVEFAIAPAFYETAWFPAVCFVAVGSTLFGLYRLRLRRLAAKMNLQLTAEQNERKRIAQELHDTLLQGFTGVGLKLDTLTNSLPASLNGIKEQFQKTLQLSDQYLTEGRRCVWKLRSPTLESAEDFSKALEKASERALNGTPIALSFSVQGQPRKLKEPFEDSLLRICEEAVANAVKHARPTRIEVTLLFNRDQVQLGVSDNGCGFNTKQSKDGHFGLVGIQERAKSMDGSFSLNSQAGTGTEIIVTVPAK